MKDYQSFLLAVNPEPWAVGALGVRRTGGKIIPFYGRNLALDAYKRAVGDALSEQETTVFEGAVALEFYFSRNLEEYVGRSGSRHRKHSSDLTNMQKATEDAIQGILIENDKNVIACRSEIIEQGADALGYVGIVVRKVRPNYKGKLPHEFIVPVFRLQQALKEESKPALHDKNPEDIF